MTLSSEEFDMGRILGAATKAKVDQATAGLTYGSEEYWAAVEPLAVEWVEAKTPSECIKFTFEFRQWIRGVRHLRGQGSVLIDACALNLNRNKVIPRPYTKGQAHFGWLPLALDEEKYSERSVELALDYTDGLRHLIMDCAEDEAVVSVVLELPNGYLCLNSEVVTL